LGNLFLFFEAFIDAFELNKHLLKVATTASAAKPSISEKSLKEAIKKLARSQSDTFLLCLAKGEGNLSFELRKK